MKLPESLREVRDVVADAASNVGGDAVQLEPLAADAVEAIRTAAAPDRFTTELDEFLHLDFVSPWNEPRFSADAYLRDLRIWREDVEVQHWLPIGRHEKDTWFVVLGDEEFARSPVVVWSSNALVTAAPFPSLRTYLLGYAEALRAAVGLYADPLRELAWTDWWQAVTEKSFGEDASPLWQRLEQPLKDLIAAEDASPLWPKDLPPMGFTDDVDREQWEPRWRQALRVSERHP